MFNERQVRCLVSMAAMVPTLAFGAPSIADAPEHSIADAPKGSLTDGAPHEVHGRLGKFGPMATVKLPPFKVTPRWESVTGYTESGVPISRRKQEVLRQAHALADAWAANQKKAEASGDAKPRAKGKTQADTWAEANAQILADEAKNGRQTTKRFVIPGMTPEQSEMLQKSGTGVVVIRGGVQVHVVRPDEEVLALSDLQENDITPEQWAALEACSRANQNEAFALPGVPSAAGNKPDTDTPKNPFETPLNESGRSTENVILEAFPDAALTMPAESNKRTQNPVHQDGSSDDLDPVPVSALGTFLGCDVGGWMDRGLAWLTGSRSVWAQGRSNVNPALEVNPMAGAFDAMAEQLARDKAAFDQRIKAESDPVHRSAEDPKTEVPASCNHCRLTPEAIDRAAKVAQATKAAKAIAETPEGQTLSGRDAEVIRDITAVLKDPNHPASFIQMMREALKANPVVEAHIPDARARLGLSNEPSQPKAETYVFVSYGLGDVVLNDILKRHAGRDDVTIVMRGIPQGVSLGEGIKHMQSLASQYTPIPHIVLDPTLFAAYDVKAVPKVVRVENRGQRLALDALSRKGQTSSTAKAAPRPAPLIAEVSGLSNDEWLQRQIELDHCTASKPCRYGEQGPVVAIIEPDMIEEMKRRVAAIDWEKKKAEAMKRFWTNQTFDELPTAAKTVRRVLDPSIHVVNDIVDANGLPIRRAGEVVNPLDARPFTSILVVFNPKREAEMTAVLAHVKRLRAEGHTSFIYMATAFDRSATTADQTLGPGWAHYEAVCDRLDSHVYLLTPEVRDRWDVRVTPTFVSADNVAKRFIVDELAPTDPE